MALKITRPQGTEDITPENISKWYTCLLYTSPSPRD